MDMDERRRRAVEAIVGDSSLTDALFDVEASRLLEWGTKLAGALSQQTAGMDGAQAAAYLDEKLADLRRVIRRTSRLVGSSAGASAEEAAELLGRIHEAAANIPGLPVLPVDARQLAGQLSGMPSGAALEAVLSMFGAIAEPPAEPAAAVPPPVGVSAGSVPDMGETQPLLRSRRPGAPPTRPGAPPAEPALPVMNRRPEFTMPTAPPIGEPPTGFIPPAESDGADKEDDA
jgi:hypothetical protein